MAERRPPGEGDDQRPEAGGEGASGAGEPGTERGAPAAGEQARGEAAGGEAGTGAADEESGTEPKRGAKKRAKKETKKEAKAEKRKAAKDEGAPAGGAEVPPAAPEPVARPRSGRASAVAALVLALAALAGLGAGGYFLYELDRTTRDQARALERAAERSAELQARIEGLEGRLSLRIEAVRQALGDLEAAHGDLRERLGRDRDGWVLAEAAYLMRLANQRLQLQRDVGTAIASLAAADQRLRALGDPALTPVREQIAREITALEGVDRPDVTGLALELASLAERAGSLPLAVAGPRRVSADAEPAGAGEADGQVGGWRGVAGAAWEDIKGLVRIRREEGRVQPMLPPEQEYFLYQNLRLKLEAARLALLEGRAEAFDTSVSTAREWLRRYFDTEAAGVRSALALLERLAAIELRPALPDISGSLRALEAARERMSGSPPGGAEGAEGGTG